MAKLEEASTEAIVWELEDRGYAVVEEGGVWTIVINKQNGCDVGE